MDVVVNTIMTNGLAGLVLSDDNEEIQADGYSAFFVYET